MKWSKYNLLYNNSQGENFLYNTRSLTMVKLDDCFYSQLTQIEKNKLDINTLLPDEIEYLRENKMVVEMREDQNFIEQLKYLKYIKSFQNETLSLIITPTLLCNFACPYCYESGLSKKSMSEDIQDKIINFINSHVGKCKNLQITWHGGEPLIAYDVIKSLLNKIKQESKLPLDDHQMVSNGFLFNEEVCEFFIDTKLKFLQITIDGTEENHNKNRIHKSGIPTYDRIIKNIDIITQKMPNCLVAVRVNVHNGNKEDFPIIYKELMKRWEGRNCYVYPAFVENNASCKVACCSPKEKGSFLISLKKNHNIDQPRDITPRIKPGVCTASFQNSYVIDSTGLIYKCWAHVGQKDRAIGNVDDKNIKYGIVAQFMLGSDKFSDEKCLQCKMLPLCPGGCSLNRIEYQQKGIAYDPCPLDESNWGEYLDTFFRKKQKESVAIDV